MFPCRPLVSPPLPRALAAEAPVSVRRLRVVRCMAKERRVRMVAKKIQRELADMLTRDPVMQRAVLPEAALGANRYLSSPTTITDVELSNDLQVCKVCVFVFGDERGKKVAMAGLKDKTKYLQVMPELSNDLQLRNLLWATSKHDVYVMQNYSVRHWSSLLRRGKEVLNVAGPNQDMQGGRPLSRVKISTMTVKDNLLAAGGFHGELICNVRRPE
ncbi:probable ribosome-binding factor A, chloroplastic [Triticum aestivum]|uniref:probable ribosome-binding factor A, chloroplastic n=1 Tax=Triticum aestivum TaxID=4565 RepID=UPI001D013829|nr:probable ribosome-binding factor A, chloroplastic [Triticum aestivum]